MDFSQLHERLRLELARRIERGVLTGTLLARQTGLRPAHISNFLNRKRRLSLAALDRVLAAQMLSIEDLLPERRAAEPPLPGTPAHNIFPLAAQSAAILSRHIAPGVIQEMIHVPAGYLDQLEVHRSTSRQDWQRFVAIRITASQAQPMLPLIRPNAILVVDRHYNSLRDLHPPQPNIYAIRIGDTLALGYVSSDAGLVILRPHSLEHRVQIFELGAREGPSDLVIGRICVILSEA